MTFDEWLYNCCGYTRAEYDSLPPKQQDMLISAYYSYADYIDALDRDIVN